MPRKRPSSRLPIRSRKRQRCRVCFVTGTRAEFGLMELTLRAIRKQPSLELQLIVTGTHTHASRGKTVDEIRSRWKVDRVIDWADSSDPIVIARETGRVSAELVDAFGQLQPDVVLVVGDRVEAFAAASAAHLCGRVVAHVHGGDRALGQTDDAVRHAITKLAHLHFAATPGSAQRIYRLGEQKSRIFTVGAPGIDGIHRLALSRRAVKKAGVPFPPDSYVLLLLHPTENDAEAERARCRLMLDEVKRVGASKVVGLMPNNDPGASGIAGALKEAAGRNELQLLTHAPRGLFLGLVRDCRMMIGNSSAGIIEAGSFNTPVVNIGPRQNGRERGENVFDSTWSKASIAHAMRLALAFDRKAASDNPYGNADAGHQIAGLLASLDLTDALRRKLIRY